ncbi:MAG: TolC family protein [Steroidobacteraceae bacterium]|nr:TolC family protein [Steroidobacteraceae bacterium]MDW8259211.1 TolC family protein [Gammaproteobacteria bacterium]
MDRPWVPQGAGKFGVKRETDRLQFGVVLAVALLGAPAAAWATETPPIDFPAAAARTLRQHPQLRGLALAIEQSRLQRTIAEQRPALELALEAEGVAGSGAYAGIGSAELSVSLQALFERAEKRAARIAAAAAQTERLQHEQRRVALDLLADTARAWIAIAAAEARARHAAAVVTGAEVAVASVRARVNAGYAPRSELAIAEMRLSAARAAHAAGLRELDGAQYRLASLWTMPHERPRAALALFELPRIAAFDALAASLAELPDLAEYASEAELRAAELRLARSAARADWRWSIGLRRYEDSGDQALIGMLSLPLGQAARAAPEIRRAELAAERAQVDAQAAAQRLRPLLYEKLQALEAARIRLTAIGAEQLPRLQDALAVTERGYRLGRFPWRELHTLQMQIADLELERIALAEQFHLTLVEIERLTGAHLPLVAPRASENAQ